MGYPDVDEQLEGILNPWNVVVCLESCFAESDKHDTPITPGERDLGFSLYSKFYQIFLQCFTSSTVKTNESNPLRLFHCFTGLISRKIEAGDKVVIEHDYTLVLPNDDENTAINEDDYAIPDCELEGTGTDTGSETGISVQYKKNAVDFWRNVGGKQKILISSTSV